MFVGCFEIYRLILFIFFIVEDSRALLVMKKDSILEKKRSIIKEEQSSPSRVKNKNMSHANEYKIDDLTDNKQNRSLLELAQVDNLLDIDKNQMFGANYAGDTVIFFFF